MGRFLGPIWTLGVLAMLGMVQAATLERDVVALRMLREEVEYRDMFWSRAVADWAGGGPGGEDDPCGFNWEGNWYGVECRGQDHLPRDVPRVVTNIHLTDLHLTGPVPLALALLSNLTEIDMDGNDLEGPLSPYMGCLPNLVEVDLANNSLTGRVPDEWIFMKKLTLVELEANPELSGCIPKGLPTTKTMCSVKSGTPVCELVGTIVFDTSTTGFCDSNPIVEKLCASPVQVRRFMDEGKPYEGYYKHSRRRRRI